MTTETLIQQEDRDAAKAIMARSSSYPIWPADAEQNIAEGIARHRIEAEERVRQSAYAAGIEDAAKVADGFAENARSTSFGHMYQGVARSIRSLGDHL